MAFDRNNAADLTALKNEVTTDPLGMGYAPDAGTAELLALLNNVSANVESPRPTGTDFMTSEKLLNAIFPVSISSQDQFKVQLIFESSIGRDDDISIFRDDIAGLSNPLSDAVNGITRELSRAEVLFSNLDANGSQESVIITSQDWFAARDS